MAPPARSQSVETSSLLPDKPVMLTTTGRPRRQGYIKSTASSLRAIDEKDDEDEDEDEEDEDEDDNEDKGDEDEDEVDDEDSVSAFASESDDEKGDDEDDAEDMEKGKGKEKEKGKRVKSAGVAHVGSGEDEDAVMDWDGPPSRSLTPDLQGASRTTGGILRGHARGNTFNIADADETAAHQLQPEYYGRVLVYESKAADAKPVFTIKHHVTPHLKPVLIELGRKHSPIRSKFICHYLALFFPNLDIL